MNYILFNSNLNWNDTIQEVFDNNFMKEVDIDGEDRIDCVFGEIDCRVFSEEYIDDGRRNSVYKIKKLFSSGGGAVFGLFFLEGFQDFLYGESDIHKVVSKFYDEGSYTSEIRSSCLQNFGLNTTNFKYYVVIYRKQQNIIFVFNDNEYLSFEKNKINNDIPMENFIPDELLLYILKHIKEKILC